MGSSIDRRTANGPRGSALETPVVFVVGTDTGVGKTLLTGLIVAGLRSAGVAALAIKPFCSGGLHDVRLLARLQRGVLGADEIAPFCYRRPLAPAVAGKLERRWIRLGSVIAHVERMRRRCELLLVEGCGGVLTPLGRDFSSLDLIRRLGGHVILVSRNRLGAINQVLMAAQVLGRVRLDSLHVVLMSESPRKGLAVLTNRHALAERLPCGVSELQYLGENACRISRLRGHVRFFQKTLAGLPAFARFSALLAAVSRAAGRETQKSALTSGDGALGY